ncbi:MAG: DUF2634 domain-containing protein [Carboxydocellales bacterium]
MVEEYEKKTPVFDWAKGDFAVDPQRRVVTATEKDAVAQIIIKAQQTVRGVHPIYADTENPDKNHTYGSDVETVLVADLTEAGRLSELERATKDAIIYDPWVTGVYGITINRQGTDKAVAELTADTIFGEVSLEGVNLTNG